MSDAARIFVGTDRSQMIGVKVLEYSIRKHSSVDIQLSPMLELGLPEPSDPRQSQRTGFSFSRFAIPKLAGYRGKALYLDADMLVFKDLAELWNIPFEGAKVIIQDDLPDEHVHAERIGAPKERIKQCAVMLLDCDRLRWDPAEIIAGLGPSYTYEQLVYQLCILRPDEIAYRIPFEWNSLEHFDQNTRLIHYTDMYTQPWVSPENPFGYLWVAHLREMMDLGRISRSEIEQEVSLGYARPSLMRELDRVGGERALIAEEVAEYLELDRSLNFVRHKDVYEAKRRRKRSIKEYERKLNRSNNPSRGLRRSGSSFQGLLRSVRGLFR